MKINAKQVVTIRLENTEVTDILTAYNQLCVFLRDLTLGPETYSTLQALLILCNSIEGELKMLRPIEPKPKWIPMQIYHMFYFPATGVIVREDGRKYTLPEDLKKFLTNAWQRNIKDYMNVPAVSFTLARGRVKMALAVHSPSDPYSRCAGENIAKARLKSMPKALRRYKKDLRKGKSMEAACIHIHDYFHFS